MFRKQNAFYTFLFWVVSISLGASAVSATTKPNSEATAVYLPIVTASLPPIIPDTTNILSDTSTQYLTNISEDGTIFVFAHATPELNNVAIGEVIMSESTPLAPNGFLRKVTAISNTSGQVVITTVQATLEEAIQQGELHIHHELSPEDIQSGLQSNGVVLTRQSTLQNSFSFQISDVVIYDEDNNSNTTNDQIVANGNINLEIAYDFDLRVQSWHLEELHFISTSTETSELIIESTLEKPLLDVEVLLANYDLAPFTVQIGVFPVTIKPKLSIHLGTNGSVQAGVSTGVTQEATWVSGVTYTNENWHSMSEFDNSFNYVPPTVTAELNMKAYTGAKLDLLIQGIVGPYAKVNLSLQLEVDPLATPWWELYGGLNVPVGVKIEIFSHFIASYEITAIDYRFLLAQSESSAEWARAYHDNVNHDSLGSGSVIQSTNDGGYIVASGTYPIDVSSSGNISVLKLYSDGSLAWRYEYGGNTMESVTAIQEIPDGGYILLGTAESDTKIWLLRLDALGSILWQKTYAYHTYNRAFSLQLTPEGGYIITGDTYNYLGEDREAWALKLHSDGTIVWQKLYGGALGDSLSQIQNTIDGGYLAIGSTESFAPGAEYNPALWALKLSAIGEISWQKTYSNTTNMLLEVHSKKSYRDRWVQHSEALGSGGHIIINGSQLLKIDDTGAVIWGKTYQEIGGSTVSLASVAENTDSSFLLVGWLPSIEFMSDDIWIGKIDDTGEIIWQTTLGENVNRAYWASSGQSAGNNYVVTGSRSYGPGDYELLVFKFNEFGEITNCNLCSTGGVTTASISLDPMSSSATSLTTTITPENSSIIRQIVSTEVVTLCGENLVPLHESPSFLATFGGSK